MAQLADNQRRGLSEANLDVFQAVGEVNMCMKYEDKYRGCLDHVFFDIDRQERYQITMFEFLASWGGELVDVERARIEFFALLEKWHEEGTIAPCKKTI